MKPGVRVKIEAHVSAEDLPSFLQTIRTWDTTHKRAEVAIWIEAPDLEVSTAEEILKRLGPPFAAITSMIYPVQQKPAGRKDPK